MTLTTFIWRETLSISVGEMSRTQAIECCRKFDALTEIYPDYVELMGQADILTVLEAPVVVKVNGDAFTYGERTIELDGEQPFKLVLPLTQDCFDAFPMSLATAWVNAALRSNEWFIDTLKKSLAMTPRTNEPESDNVQSKEQNIASQTITTIGK